MTAQTEIKQFSLTYQPEEHSIKIVDDVTFSIQPGEIVALLGESGCGKSALAQGVMRLLPSYARYGMSSVVTLDNVDLLTLPECIMRGLRGYRMGIVFQEPMTALNPVLTIRTQLAEAILQHEKLNQRALERRMKEALIEVELPEPEIKLSQYPHQLSGGQKQRVVLAIALAGHPQLLIADEPTTALDVTIQAQILALLKRLRTQRKMSVLLITHDMGVVKAVANRVCVMYAGEVVELANVDTFFNDVRHPYVQQLLISAPAYHKRHALLNMMQGQVPLPGAWPSGCRFHPRCVYAFDRCTQEKPALLSWGEGSIRCHLYEQHQGLNAIPQPQIATPPLQNKETQAFDKQEVILEAHQIGVSFPIKIGHLYPQKIILKAVDQVSFQVKRGKTLAVVGESGSGKTTLSRALLNLYPLTEGKLVFKHQDFDKMSQADWRNYRKAVQMVFQDPYHSLNPRMTIGEILAEGMRVQRMSERDIQKKQLILLDQVSLPQTSLLRYPHEFSGGQRQRIGIARALSTDPEVLVCDEPTSALDVSIQAQILNLFKELQAARGLAYVFVTHNMAVVSYLADDVLVMKEGRVVESGSIEEILFHSKHAYTKQLLGSVLSFDMNQKT